MNTKKLLNDLYVFLIKLKIQIKLLPEEKFKELFEDKTLDYTQKLYLCIFRYL